MGLDTMHICRRSERCVIQLLRSKYCHLPAADITLVDISDLALVDRLSNGKVDLTFGSSLDIFGGKGVRFDELVRVDKEAKQASQ